LRSNVYTFKRETLPHIFCVHTRLLLKKTALKLRKNKGKGTANPVRAWRGPEGSRKLRVPDLKIIGTRRWQSAGPKYTPPIAPPPLRKYPWGSCVLEA